MIEVKGSAMSSAERRSLTSWIFVTRTMIKAVMTSLTRSEPENWRTLSHEEEGESMIARYDARGLAVSPAPDKLAA